MDFSYTEEQTAVRDLVRSIYDKQVHNAYLRDLESTDYRYDKELWQILADAGLLGVAIPESSGGMGYSFTALALLVEESARVLAPLPILQTLMGGAYTLRLFGSEAQQTCWLKDIAQGKTLMSVALSEAGNLDPCSPCCQAREQKGGWLLSGNKILVPYADICARILVSAKTPGGHGVFMVDPQSKNVDLHRQHCTSGEPQFAVHMDGVQITPEDVLAADQQGTKVLHSLVEHMLCAYCVMALGISEQMMRMTASYVSEREQFGVKIGTFQAVGHRAADCFIDNSCLRLTTEQAVSFLDHGEDAHKAVQVAKIWASDATHRVSYASQHLHGGTGVDRDYALFRYCLWAKHAELALMNGAQTLSSMGAEIVAKVLTKRGASRDEIKV
jgi:alkylation response protein AidB-like acyl-CoA dehydrogenase